MTLDRVNGLSPKERLLFSPEERYEEVERDIVIPGTKIWIVQKARSYGSLQKRLIGV